jgi:hypothetical protein
MSSVTFRYTAADLVNGWRVHRRHSSALLRGRLVLLAIAIAAGVYAYAVGGLDHPVAMTWGAVGGLVPVAIIVIADRPVQMRRARRTLAQQKSLQGEVTFDWDTQGVAFTNAVGHSRLAWSDYARWRESKASLVLFQSDNLINIIPKRCFTEAQLAEIRSGLGVGQRR